MTGLKQHLRNPGLVLGILAVIIAATGTSVAVGYATSAKGSTIKACVAKSSKNIYQAKKCKKGDKKLTWSITGPQGPKGDTGAAGANGAVAGYSATQAGSQDITANTAFTTIISKSLPAGNYIVNAKAQLAALHTANTQGASEQCRLNDGTKTDGSQVAGALGPVFIVYTNVGTASMSMPVTGPATVSLQCRNDLTAPPAGYSLNVSQGKITAVQTTSNN